MRARFAETAHIAVNSQTAPNADLPIFLEGASRAGFTSVELSGELLFSASSDGLLAVRESGLEVVGLSPTEALFDWHWRWDNATHAALAAELELSAALGAQYFVLPFMRERGDDATVSRHLHLAERIAQDAGVKLAVEPIGHHDVLRRAQDIARVVADCDSDVVGILLDSFHFFRADNTLDDLVHFTDVPVLALQVSNANGVPRDQLLGYRDRTFPLDGPFAVQSLVEWWHVEHPGQPLIVEVIGDVVQHMSTDDALERAFVQASRLAAVASNPQSSLTREP